MRVWEVFLTLWWETEIHAQTHTLTLLAVQDKWRLIRMIRNVDRRKMNYRYHILLAFVPQAVQRMQAAATTPFRQQPTTNLIVVVVQRQA